MRDDIEDLRGFGQIIGDARIVGMGEPTHGNREIYQLKNRIFDYLVREKGFTHFGLEAPFAETGYLDDYVVHGKGSAEEALSSITMWAWDVEEIAALLNGMRAWNENKSASQRLRVFGFDMQSPERAAREVLAALDELAPSLAVTARRNLGTLAIPFNDPDGWGYRPTVAEEANQSALTIAREVLAFFSSEQVANQSSLERSEISRLRHLAQNLLWWVEANHDGGRDYNRIRDFAQAGNVDWVLGQNDETAKIFLWAHNVHLADLNTQRLGGTDMAGSYLKRRHGDDYVIVGAFYGEGHIRASDAVPWGQVRTFATGNAGPNFLESQFSQDLAASILDIRTLPQTGEVHDWFSTMQRTRHSGGGWADGGYALATFDYILPNAFDVLAFVPTSSPTRPLSARDTAVPPPLSAPANLGFENAPDGIPTDWLDWSKQRRWGYTITTSTDAPPEGERFARLCRSDGAMSADAGGSLMQYVDGTPWRGRDLTISAMTKVDLHAGAQAFLRVKVQPALGSDVHATDMAFSDTLDSYAIDHEEWLLQTVSVRIPDEAAYIMFGLNLAGEGCVSIDSVQMKAG